MPTTKDIVNNKKKKIRAENFHYPNKQDKKKTKEKPPKDFSLIKAIRNEPLHKNNVVRRDKQVRKYVDELEKSPEFVSEFSSEMFTSLIEKVVVKAKDDIRFIFKNGFEVRVQRQELMALGQ